MPRRNDLITQLTRGASQGLNLSNRLALQGLERERIAAQPEKPLTAEQRIRETIRAGAQFDQPAAQLPFVSKAAQVLGIELDPTDVREQITEGTFQTPEQKQRAESFEQLASVRKEKATTEKSLRPEKRAKLVKETQRVNAQRRESNARRNKITKQTKKLVNELQGKPSIPSFNAMNRHFADLNIDSNRLRDDLLTVTKRISQARQDIELAIEGPEKKNAEKILNGLSQQEKLLLDDQQVLQKESRRVRRILEGISRQIPQFQLPEQPAEDRQANLSIDEFVEVAIQQGLSPEEALIEFRKLNQ